MLCKAASLRNRPTAVAPVAKTRLRKGRLVYPPSTTTQAHFPASFSSGTTHSTNLAAS